MSAVAMSLAILGTVSVIPGNNNPKKSSAIVANATSFTDDYGRYTRPSDGRHDTRSKVKWIQSALNDYFSWCLLDVDGVYGGKTTQVVSMFQQDFNDHYSRASGIYLAVDGDFGPATLSAFAWLGY